MMKRWVKVMLVLLLSIIFIAACGNNEKTDANKDPATNNEQNNEENNNENNNDKFDGKYGK